jgi:TolB-like protein/Flp pilus assembly protein TadD
VRLFTARIYGLASRLDESFEQVRKIIEIEPNFGSSYIQLGGLYMMKGQYDKAVVEYQKALALSGFSAAVLSYLGACYGVLGNRSEAHKMLDQLLGMRKSRYVAPFCIARVYSGLGENDKAFEWFEKSFEERNGEMVALKSETLAYLIGNSVIEDPRFQDLIRRVGLPTDKTNQTDESLEAKTVMLKSEPPAVAGGFTQTSQDAVINSTTPITNLQPSATADGSDLSAKPKSKWWLFGLLSLIILIGGYFGYRSYQSTLPINSIAVLPFENKSSDADSDYLSDGLAESLIYRLSQLPNLKVSPTSSVFRYKGKATDPNTVAKELEVDSVLTGRIVQRGDNLNISVNLVDTRNGKSLWGEQYERKMSELLATQREIASEIVSKLQLKISGEEKGLTKQYTNNNEAYQLYLKGRYSFAKRTKDEMLKAVEYYRQAIALDPNFALAYARVAEVYNQMPAYPYLAPNESFPQAKTAAQRALEIDPNLAEAHTAMGNYLGLYERKWTEAEREFKRGLELDPNSSAAHFRYAQTYLIPLGRTDEAITEINRALEIEPLDLNMRANFSWFHLYARQNDKALTEAKRMYELDPNFVLARYTLGLTYNANGMYADTIDLNQKFLETNPTNQYLLRNTGYAYAKSGRRQEAEETIKKLNDISRTQYVMSFWIASIYAALGDKDKAFAELEKGFAQNDLFIVYLKVDPQMDSLRDDARFKDLLKRMNLPE